MLEVQNLHLSYGTTPVLKDVSVGFQPRCVTAIVGPNGCGKSSLLKAIMGFLPFDKGAALLNGHSISGLGRRDLARRIAYLPQENICPEHVTVGELVELAGYARYSLFGGASDKDKALFQSALETVGLSDLSHRRVSALSGGQRQRAWIAMTLAQDADIILMDEPVNHLDVKYQIAILKLVRDLSTRQGKTVVTVLHDLNLTSAFADNVVMMNDGQLVAAGSVTETITPASIHQVFGLHADVIRHKDRLVCIPEIDDALAEDTTVNAPMLTENRA